MKWGGKSRKTKAFDSSQEPGEKNQEKNHEGRVRRKEQKEKKNHTS
jgi:hypothetical protein